MEPNVDTNNSSITTIEHSVEWVAKELFKVDWNPLVEHRQYVTMEGHLEMFNEIEKEPDNVWKRLYFRTRDGRFQWFASHCADEHPISDILLTGAEVKANRGEWTLHIKGGKENADLRLRVPSNVFDKWQQALFSHSSSSLVDAYIQPVWPTDPHRTNKVLILEVGRHSIRAGILTQKPSLPYCFYPQLCAIDDQLSQVVCGIDAFSADRNWKVIEPIQIDENGTYLDRHALMALLQKIKNDAISQANSMDIRFRIQDYSVLLSIAQHMDIVAATEVLKMLLDKKTLGFKNVSIVRQPSLILYSYDVTTGVVVDLGEHFSIVPVIDEFVVDDAVQPIPFGAQHLREQIAKNVNLQQAFGLLGESPLIRELLLKFVVEKACYVAAGGFEEERRKLPKDAIATLQLAGKQVTIPVDSETRFAATEGLFKPEMWGLAEVGGLHRQVHDAIQRCPIDSRRPLYRAIYLTGGTTLLRGLAERLEKEITQLVPSSVPVQVLNSPWRRHSAYLGAHLIATAHEFTNQCVNEREIGEYLRRMSTV